MEMSPKTSSARRSYEIQEIGETSERVEPPIGEDPTNEDTVERARYFSRRDRASKPTSSMDEEVLDCRTELILLQHEPTRGHATTATGREMTTSRRIIELSDSDCKLALRRHLRMVDVGRGRSNSRAGASATATGVRRENAEILGKLPPETVVIRQEARRSSREDSSDYRELTESDSSSGDSSSSSGCAATKMKRIPRAARNKTRETVKVRRNPMRESKKVINKDFPRPRQRLLADSKTEIRSNYQLGKRTRAHTMPYMNTRSVTRKMYNVGATYQAPTKRDEIEWKEWPVHGMHERPVYHPQAGLAVEYLGRYYTSLDGLSYSEITDEPEIEVIAVNPHGGQQVSSSQKKGGKAKVKSKRSSNPTNTQDNCPSTKDKSFETYMHKSLHSVLGYCSQVMTPSREQAVKQTAVTKVTIPASATSILISTKESVKENAMRLRAYAIAMTQTVQNKSTVNNNAKVATSTVVSSTVTHLPETQRPRTSKATVNLGTTSQSDAMKPSELRGFPTASLALLKDPGTRTGHAACATKTFNTAKLEDMSVKETLRSIYKKLVFESALNREGTSASGSSRTLKRHFGTTERDEKKTTLESLQLENAKVVQTITRGLDEGAGADNAKIKQSDSGMPATSSIKILPVPSATSEIARILSEYNRGTTRKSAIQMYGSTSRNLETKCKLFDDSGTRNLMKAMILRKKDIEAIENRDLLNVKSLGLDPSDEKPKKLLTLEEIRSVQVADSNQNARDSCSTSSGNRQALLKDRQMSASIFNRAQEKPAVVHTDISKDKASDKVEIVAIGAKAKEVKKSECSKNETETSRTEEPSFLPLQELLENTAILYCAATGIHQDDLSIYVDTLDSKQSIEWLEDLDKSE